VTEREPLWPREGRPLRVVQERGGERELTFGFHRKQRDDHPVRVPHPKPPKEKS
jgi:hypothetical protein